ncbi:MAG: AAA family ATPase [Microgenomates group bacterium]
MKIIKVTIENFKSIKKLEFAPNLGLNAFIGANSTGKSNVMDAINWLLGPVYPSFNSTRREDHFLGDEDNKIRIKLEFDDDNYLELAESWTDGRGYEKSGLNYNGSYANGEIREKYCCAYLGVQREISDYLPSNRWSLMGRILQEVNKRFATESITYKGETKSKKDLLKEWLSTIREKLLFSVNDAQNENIMKKFVGILREETARQLNRPLTDFTVDLTLYDPWNFYKTLQLIVKEPDMDMEFPASSLGMGVQASISVAILKAYSELNLANNSPIFIDEPELYLHPQAQNNFYKILRELARNKYDEEGRLIKEGTQVFYTTHSPNFLSAGYFNEIFVVRKTIERGTYIRQANTADFVADLQVRKGITYDDESVLTRYRNAYENTGDTQKANEAFFAKKIILVEGQSETLVLPLLFQTIDFDYVQEGISIVRCGCKGEIGRFFRLYTEFGIPCYVIFDGDKQLDGTEEMKNNIKENKEIISFFEANAGDYPDNIAKENYLGFEYVFEDNLNIKTTKKGLGLYIQIKQVINNNELSTPSWVSDIKQNLISLNDETIQSVLKRNEGSQGESIPF